MTSFLTWLFNLDLKFQKLIAVLFALVFALVASSISLLLLSHSNSLVAENTEKRELLGKLTRIAELKPDMQNSNASTNSYDDIFLRGETVAVAGANLHSIVDGMARANNVSISSVTNLPVKVQAGVELVGLKLVIIGPLEKVHKVIFGIETANPPLLVGDMAIQGVRSQSKLVEPNIAVNIDIFGAKRPELQSAIKSEES